MSSFKDQLMARRAGLAPGTTSEAPATAGEAIAQRFAEAQRDDSARLLTLAQIEEDADQARKTFKDIDQLAESIRRHGLQQPVVVEEIGAHRYRLRAGHRRYRAFLELAKEDPAQYNVIPARLMPSVEAIARRIAQYHENTERAGYEPMEEARELKRLQDELACTQSELAQQINRSQSYVSRVLALLDQDDMTISKLEAGELAKSATRSDVTARPAKTEAARVPRVAVAQPAIEAAAKLLQVLAERHALEPIMISKQPTKKELIAILEARTRDILRAVKSGG